MKSIGPLGFIAFGIAVSIAVAGPGPGESTLTPGDTVRIEIHLEPDLTTVTTIDAAGGVRLPLVDNLTIAGLSTAQAQSVIERAYHDGQFLLKPHATVQVEARVEREVMISGQVRAPGSYALPPDRSLSVIDLIAKAGGLTELARANAVTVTHTTAGGEKQTTVVEAARLIRGEGDAKDPGLLLAAGDIVYVPERIF